MASKSTKSKGGRKTAKRGRASMRKTTTRSSRS